MMPVILARQVNLRRAKRQAPEIFTGKQILILGIAGILPDLLSPHIWLDQRHSAYSHSLVVLVIFSLISLLILRKNKGLATLSIAAYALHIFCDYISGGIPLLLPFNNEIYAQYWLLPPIDWVIADITLFLGIYFQSWYRRFRLKN